MLLLVVRKMLHNRWMFLCLLIGSILAVAILSSIPVYTDGILQRMLIKDLENYQQTSGVFPGGYYIKANMRYNFTDENSKINVYNKLNNIIKTLNHQLCW